MKTPATSTTWAIVDWEVDQDAGGRRLRSVDNAPIGSNGDFATPELGRAMREIRPPIPVQEAQAILLNRTSEIGDARQRVAALVGLGAAVPDVPHLVRRHPPSRAHSQALQEWEGTVLDRRADSILVRLVDKTNGGSEEEAEILLTELSPHDLPLVRSGAVFYWTIGYRDSVTGQRTRESSIVFRRLPAWTDSELAALRKKVRRQGALFRWV
jgi:hypothetical protein